MANCPGNNIWLALMAVANTRAPITRTQSETLQLQLGMGEMGIR